MKILYFTATGNSLYIAKALGGETYSIPQLIKEGTFEFTDEKIGIVFPLHAWSVNPYMEEFLSKAKFNCKYLFAVVTYGVYTGAVATHLTNIGAKAGYKFDYINKIRMVDNYLPGFDMKKEAENEHKKNIEENLEKIKKDIESSTKFMMKESPLDRMATGLMLKPSKKPSKKVKLKVHKVGEGIERFIKVNDNCTQCGVCTKVCPVENIELDKTNGKIKLADKCFMCFACVQNCPQNAIHINGEKTSDRFRNKNVKLKEIIDANNQKN